MTTTTPGKTSENGKGVIFLLVTEVYTDAEIKKALDGFRRNPTWKEYYDEAPSEECRKYITAEFCWSVYDDRERETELKESILAEFSKTDWAYIGKYAGNNPFGARCRRMAK